VENLLAVALAEHPPSRVASAHLSGELDPSSLAQRAREKPQDLAIPRQQFRPPQERLDSPVRLVDKQVRHQDNEVPQALVLEDAEVAVGVGVSPDERRTVRRVLTDVLGQRAWLIHAAPTTQSGAPVEVGVLEIREVVAVEVLVPDPDLHEHRTPVDRRRGRDAEDLLAIVELSSIDLLLATVDHAKRLVEDLAGRVDDPRTAVCGRRAS